MKNVFLDTDIGRDLARAKEGVLGLVYSEVFSYAIKVFGIGIIVAFVEFVEVYFVGSIAVNFVGRQVDKGYVGRVSPSCFEEVEGADNVGIEVFEWDIGSSVVARLCSGVYDGIRAEIGDQFDDTISVSNVDFVMHKTRQFEL